MPSYNASLAATELLRRSAARQRLYAFAQYINPDYIESDFAEKVCAALDAFLIDMEAGRRPVLVLGAPPQHGKSQLVSRYLPAYALGRYPDMRIGGLSYAFPLATSMNRDVQRIMMDDPYRRLFTQTKLNDRRAVTLEVEAKRNSEEFEVVGRRGYYIGQGVGGPLTGKSLDLGIIDDPIKNAQEAMSQTIKDRLWEWYISTFLTRLSKNGGQIIMATRWCVDDLSGRIIDRYPQAKVLMFKAISDDGKALVPELHPIEKLEETKATLGPRYWEAMYQQSPTIQDGGTFRPEKIEIVDALPAEIKWVRGWDLAATKDAGDWTAGVKLGIKNGITYIANAVRERGSPERVESLLVQTAKMDECKQSIPQDPGQAGKAQAAYLSKKLAGCQFTFSAESGDKATRAMPMASQVNAGNVKMLAAPWNESLIHEMRSFPTGAHDDLIDACSRAYNELMTGSSYSLKNL